MAILGIDFGFGTIVTAFLITIWISILAMAGMLIYFIRVWSIKVIIRKERGRDALVAEIKRAKIIKTRSGQALRIWGKKEPVPYHEGCFIPLENKKRGSMIDIYEDNSGDLHPCTFAVDLETEDGHKFKIPSIIPEDVDTKAWAAYEHRRTERLLERKGFKEVLLPMGLFLLVIVGILFVMIIFFKNYTEIAKNFSATFQPIAQAIAEGKFG